MMRALSGTVMPSAFSTARTDAMACTVVQTPQMRSAKSQASRGSRPFSTISSPRKAVPELQASVMRPFSICTSMRRWPSMRVIGSMAIRRAPGGAVVAVGVAVAVAIGVGVAVLVDAGVRVGVGVLVAVAVLVGVDVFVGVGVLVGAGVLVVVGVLVDVAVRVGVEVRVGVRVFLSSGLMPPPSPGSAPP